MERDNSSEPYAFVPDLFLPDLFSNKDLFPGDDQYVPVSDSQQEGRGGQEQTDNAPVSPWRSVQGTATDYYGFHDTEAAPNSSYQAYPPPHAYPVETPADPLYGANSNGGLFPSTSEGALRAAPAAAAQAPAQQAPGPVHQANGPETAAVAASGSVTAALCCPVCCRTFRHKLGLTNHQRVHTARHPHTCYICGETFKYKTNFKRHRRVHAKEMRICRYCGDNMESDYDLVQHEKEHRRLQKL